MTTTRVYAVLADGVLALHLAFILWVVFGAFVTRFRRSLRWIHIACLLWGIAIEVGPWPCPLTLAENALEARAGMQPYQGPFLLHYLDKLVYPNVPDKLLVWGAVAVCVLNLAFYITMFRTGSRKGSLH